MLNLNDLRIFVKVAQCSNLSLAAKELALPKSKVSRRLLALEADLEFRLFHRTNNRLHLTQQGEELLAQYADTFAVIERKERLVNDIGHSLKGRLKISIPSDLVNTHFNDSLTDFKLRYPDVDLECHVTSHYNEFATADYDVALLLNSHQLPDGDYIAKKLFDVQSSLFIATSFDTDESTALSLAQLLEHPHISHTFDNHWAVVCNGQPSLIALNRAVKIDSILAQRSMAIAGLGIVRLPDFYCIEAVEQGKLRKLNFVGVTQPYQVCIAYSDRHLQPRVVDVFINYYKQVAHTMAL